MLNNGVAKDAQYVTRSFPNTTEKSTKQRELKMI